MLLLALVVRLLLINGAGFPNDIASFEGWTLRLVEHPLRDFYATAQFADYPPGYLFVLAFVGHVYKLVRSQRPDVDALSRSPSSCPASSWTSSIAR